MPLVARSMAKTDSSIFRKEVRNASLYTIFECTPFSSVRTGIPVVLESCRTVFALNNKVAMPRRSPEASSYVELLHPKNVV